MTKQSAQPSLFDRMGGQEGITGLITSFYERVLEDPELAGFFEKTDMAKLHRMQVEFFSAALGGPAIYSGRSLREIHAGRGIKKHHLQRFVEHLLATLQSYDLEENEVRSIYDRIAVHADAIADGGTETG